MKLVVFRFALLAEILVIFLALAGGCEREKRKFSELPAAAAPVNMPMQKDVQPGGKLPADTPGVPDSLGGPYDRNAFSVAEGKRLYEAYNCVGCHSHGGGGMGPALMDDKWIYGSSTADIYHTIAEGRPNGMPAFGGRIPPFQIWEIAAYVRSMSGLLSKDVAPGRDDAMNSGPAESRTKKMKPVPGPAEHP